MKFKFLDLPRTKCAAMAGGLILAYGATLSAQSVPAFPGAEGFGAIASGGRAGRVIYVTNLDPDINGQTPGSFNWALAQSGPRYILFKVSGVVHARANIIHGDVTIAGQTSPGGVIVRGLVCDGHYERNSCDNVIVRHMRLRPASNLPVPPGISCRDSNEGCLSDGLRLDGINRFMGDHLSISNADDETVQMSWASDVTLQYSMLGENVSDHAPHGGMLLNYSHADHRQDRISVHHNAWYRIQGRLPEFTCEASNYEGQTGTIAQCQADTLRAEISNNLYYDPGRPMYYNRDVDQNGANGPYKLHLNIVNNRFVARPDRFRTPMMMAEFLEPGQNSLYVSGNTVNLFPGYADYQLFDCDCEGFSPNAAGASGAATKLPVRHGFPAISYQSGESLIGALPRMVGALPHDAQDRRYENAMVNGTFSNNPYSQADANDAHNLDFTTAPAAPLDSDNDGMPNAFEIQYAALGLNPNVADHNGAQLSMPLTGMNGYTNLECYLNQLADQLAGSNSGVLFGNGFE